MHVLTRGEQARQLAWELGAAQRRRRDRPRRPSPSTPPSSSPRPASSSRWRCAALDRGGTLSRRRHPPDRHPRLNYQAHLFQERQLRSVTANTRRDGEELLRIAATTRLDVRTTAYPFEAADRALADLAHDRVTGAAVIDVAGRATRG